MGTLDAVLDDLHGVELSEVPDGRLLEEVDELLVARNRLDAAISLRLGRAHANQTCVTECGHGVKQYLVSVHRVGDRDAGRQVQVARGLVGHPLVTAAYVAGDLSFEAVRRLLGCFGKLPAAVHGAAEPVLVDAARTVPLDDLGAVVDLLRDAVGGDSAEAREQRRFDSRWLRLSRTFDGMLHLEGMLDPESGATVQAAIRALLDTRPGDDPRTVDQARADALTDLARQSQAHANLPTHHGDRPAVTVTLDWDTLRDQAADIAGRPAPWRPDLPDRLTELRGQATTSTLPAPAATLGSGPHGAFEITPEAARRICCDARILPAVLSGDSQPLDLGRDTRTWTLTQRRAAALRDQGCTFTGCQAGLDRCELHHLHHWAHGGPTNHDNSAHLCHYHHWLVHHRNWTITRNKTTKKIQVSRT